MIYLLTIIIAILQLTIVNFISIGNIKPDLLLVLVVFVALKKGPWKAVAIGILAGFLKDMFSFGTVINTVSMPLYGFLTGIARQRFYFIKEGLLTEALVVLSVCVLDSVVMIMHFSNWDYPPSLLILIFFIAVPAVLYTCLVSIPIFSILKRYAH